MSLRSFTLDELVRRNAALHGARPAFVAGDRTVTHAEYASRVGRLAAGLARAGVGAGDRVAVLAPNSLEFCDLYGAVARLGAILVPVNARLSPEEAAHVLADVSPRAAVVAPALRALLAGASLDGARRFVLGAAEDGWEPFESLYGVGSHEAASPVDDDAGLVIIHTAAVGGKPRGALLTHRGLLASSVQCVGLWGLTADDVYVGALPMFHVAGLNLMLAVQHAGGAMLVLQRFDPDALAADVDRHRGSVVGTFPPMLAQLLDAAERGGASLASLRVATGIEMPDTIARFQARCAGAAFWVGYGQTETSGMVSLSPFAERPGSAGRPVPLCTIAVVDDEDRAMPVGESGEIVVRGPTVFGGYWKLDADNAATFRAGWHHTGDLGRLDADGYLWYQGRSPAKELIKPGGENVYPAEVERTLREHPAILEAVVFGVPDAQWGEAVAAVCVARPGTTPDEKEVIEFVGSRIARYKRPRRVHFVAELPRAANGAPDRAAVKTAHGAI
ncbi:MAG TPA: AMP-binding protein [Burkholderiaceae bacterium]|nr:AMP-binding protein [Burkholderiaceae bacterium]